MFFVDLRLEYIKTEKHVNQLLLRKKQLKNEIFPLIIEEKNLTQLNVIEIIAKEDLSLGKPEKAQIKQIIIQP